MMMVSDGSTATSKRTKRKISTAMDSGDDLAGRCQGQHPSAAGGGDASVWTEEMHSSFLHDMEAAFVHDILFGWPAGHAATSHRIHHHDHNHHQQPMSATTTTDATPRLDRYMPDSAESTRDGHGDAAPAVVHVRRTRARSMRRNRCIAGGKPTAALPSVWAST